MSRILRVANGKDVGDSGCWVSFSLSSVKSGVDTLGMTVERLFSIFCVQNLAWMKFFGGTPTPHPARGLNNPLEPLKESGNNEPAFGVGKLLDTL
jgi:hypothetical protein